MDTAEFYGIALELLDCVVEKLGSGAPARRFITAGSAIHDECCSGQLTVSLMRAYDAQQGRFPAEFGGMSTCDTVTTILQLDVVILRCAPEMVDGDNPLPTIARQQEVARLTAIEAHAVRRGAKCCFDANATDFVVQGTTWIDPEDGCAGSSTTVLVDVGVLCCD